MPYRVSVVGMWISVLFMELWVSCGQVVEKLSLPWVKISALMFCEDGRGSLLFHELSMAYP